MDKENENKIVSVKDLYTGCRSYRRFLQKEVPGEIIEELLETARKRSCGRNAQELKFLAVVTPETVKAIQPCFHWAASLPKEIGAPKPGEVPVAFILVLVPEKAGAITSIDAGIALDAMALTAWSHGVGSCIIANISRKELTERIPVPDGYSVLIALALGYPAHTSTIVAPDEEHGLKYYVDAERNYYVPKRPAEDVWQIL